MRQYVVMAGIGALVLSAAPAHATGVKYRTVKAPYQTPGGFAGVLTGDATIQGNHYGGVKFYPNKGEYAVTLSAVDTTGLPVSLNLSYDLDGDGSSDADFGDFCSTTKVPIKLLKGTQAVLVTMSVGQCATGVSVPTTGTVTAKFAAKK